MIGSSWIENISTKKDVYNNLLTDKEYREERNLYIYKKGNKIDLYLQEENTDYDFDTESLTSIPIPIPDRRKWDENKNPKGPPGYAAVNLKRRLIGGGID